MQTRAAQIAEIDALLARYDRKFALTFLEGVRAVQSSISLERIEQILRENHTSAAVYSLRTALEGAGYISFAATITEAMLSGGDLGQRIASASRIEFGFDVAESNTARFLSGYRAQRIREIEAATAETISQIVYREASLGKNPASTARMIRDSIGLTAHQEQHVTNYRQFLEDLPKRRATESALKEYTLRDKRFDASMVKAIENSKGMSAAQIDKMVEAYRRRYLSRRAQNIARTESMTMLQSGQYQYWEQLSAAGIVNESEIVRKWIVTADSKLRHAHAQIPVLNPNGVGLKIPFKSPLGMIRYPCDPMATAANRINCFHPETKISGNILSASKAMYSGDMIAFKTLSGKKFTVTPNHPILSDKGFVGAMTLDKGDYLFSKRDQAIFSDGIACADVQDSPIKAAEVFNSLSMMFDVSYAEGMSFDFNGDGKFINSDINIISPNGFLRGNAKAVLSKLISNFGLIHPYLLAGMLEFYGSFIQSLLRVSLPSSCILSATNNLFDSGIATTLNLHPFKGFRFGLTSNVDAIFKKYSAHAMPSNPVSLAQFVTGDSSNIFRDEIVDIHVYKYSGYVYDFESDTGYLLADNVTVSNCRCHVFTRINKAAT